MTLAEYFELCVTIEKTADRKEFKEYFALCRYDRMCLNTTNYWKKRNGQTEIKAPTEDTYYYKPISKKEV
jgi:hypothetical protein